MGLGAAAIADDLLAHWVLGLHRAVAGDKALYVELALVALGAVLLGIGLWREGTRGAAKMREGPDDQRGAFASTTRGVAYINRRRMNGQAPRLWKGLEWP